MNKIYFPLKASLILIVLFCCFLGQLHPQISIKSSREAADFAVANSNIYSLKRLMLESSAKSARLSISEFLPKLDLSWTEDDSVKVGGADTRAKSISAGVTQLVFDGGKAKLAYDMNKTASYYNLKLYESELNRFRSSVIDSYYEILQLQQQVMIQDQLESNAKIQLDIMKKETELGLALETDYFEYLISFNKIQDETKQYKRELRTKLRTFKILIGLEITSEVIVTDSVEEDMIFLPCLEDNIDYLWQILKNNSPIIKKSRAEFFYAEKQYLYSNRIYMPNISLNGNVAFSGTAYPLNNPNYTAKVIISFPSNSLFPISLQNGYTINQHRLAAVNNSASVSVIPQPDFFVNKRTERISLNSKRQDLHDEETALYESLFEKVAMYDDCVDAIERLKDTIQLQEKRLLANKLRLEKGLLKKIEYLELLQQLAQQKITLAKSEISIKSIVRELEIMLCIPFGGLKTCLQK